MTKKQSLLFVIVRNLLISIILLTFLLSLNSCKKKEEIIENKPPQKQGELVTQFSLNDEEGKSHKIYLFSIDGSKTTLSENTVNGTKGDEIITGEFFLSPDEMGEDDRLPLHGPQTGEFKNEQISFNLTQKEKAFEHFDGRADLKIPQMIKFNSVLNENYSFSRMFNLNTVGGISEIFFTGNEPAIKHNMGIFSTKFERKDDHTFIENYTTDSGCKIIYTWEFNVEKAILEQSSYNAEDSKDINSVARVRYDNARDAYNLLYCGGFDEDNNANLTLNDKFYYKANANAKYDYKSYIEFLNSIFTSETVADIIKNNQIIDNDGVVYCDGKITPPDGGKHDLILKSQSDEKCEFEVKTYIMNQLTSEYDVQTSEFIMKFDKQKNAWMVEKFKFIV